MAMLVQHNMQAANANRMLGKTVSNISKSTEKLSSGYRINRAADDAAGLSISEKMRKQIRGLTQASTNAQDGISAVQTSEGALTEVHSMLQRMNELATQAANGTNSEDDRKSIQNEIDQLATEIDRVAETTKFNETYLLKGNGTTKESKINAHDAGIKGTLIDNGETAEFKVGSELEVGDKISIAGKDYTIAADKAPVAPETTDGYAAVGDTNFTGTTVGVGDSIYDSANGNKYTIVNKVEVGDISFDTSKANAFTVTHSDGTTESYTLKDTPTGSGANELTKNGAMDLIAQAIENGEKITLQSYNDATVDNIEIVGDGALQTVGSDREVSILDTNFATTSTVADLQKAAKAIDSNYAALAAGDVATINGKEITATDNTPKTASDIDDVIKALGEGDLVQIKRWDASLATPGYVTQTLKVGTETDAIKGTYTAEDLAAVIQEGDQISVGINSTHSSALKVANEKGITNVGLTGGAFTAAPDTTNTYTVVGSLNTEENSSDSNSITKDEALAKIAEELAKASSIGTDEGKEATVENNGDGTFTINKGSVKTNNALTFTLHVGADTDMTNKISIDIQSLDSTGLGIKGINVADDTGIAATYAVDAIEDAIKTVSAQRSTLGAAQNRLEHTISNLDNVVENTTSAESRIRDVDMASEMVTYSKNNILQQAGQSMLAQANQANQGILSLLG